VKQDNCKKGSVEYYVGHAKKQIREFQQSHVRVESKICEVDKMRKKKQQYQNTRNSMGQPHSHSRMPD
jgi:hypothetical protein